MKIIEKNKYFNEILWDFEKYQKIEISNSIHMILIFLSVNDKIRWKKIKNIFSIEAKKIKKYGCLKLN